MGTQGYKMSHPPRAITENDSGKPHQGVYQPKHPEKVVGGDIIYRSGWELAFARWCDDNPAVIQWGGEPTSIQYRNPSEIDFDACKKTGANPLDPSNWPVHNYYPDFFVHLKDPNNPNDEVKKLLIEIKPRKQTERPSAPPTNAKLKEQRAYVKAVKTYLQNKMKWTAAIEWCKPRGYDFKVYTEVTLQGIGII